MLNPCLKTVVSLRKLTSNLTAHPHAHHPVENHMQVPGAGAKLHSPVSRRHQQCSFLRLAFLQVDPSQQRHARWTRCAYSGKPLKEPIVADPLGNLFNKADLLEGLAAKASGEPWPLSLSHIRLKDLLPVQVQPNPSYEQCVSTPLLSFSSTSNMLQPSQCLFWY